MSTMLEEVLSGPTNAGQKEPHGKKHCGCASCRRKRQTENRIPSHLAEAEDNHLLGEVFKAPLQVTKAAASVPALISDENNGGGYTAYVGIDLHMSKND